MNQIIFVYENKLFSKNETSIRKKNIYLFIFIITLIIILFIITYIFYTKYFIYKKNIELKKIKQSYNISTLYNVSSSYSSIKLSNDIEIIGLIEIPKLNISYPILSKSSKNLLKISVCRFLRSTSKYSWKFMHCWT